MTTMDSAPTHTQSRPRDHLTLINYFDFLPNDVLSHLFIYLKLFDDEEMYSLGKTSRSMLSFSQTRFERSGIMKWYLYTLGEIEAKKLKFPWTSHEERSRYVLISTIPHPDNGESDQDAAVSNEPPEQTVELEWVILKHDVDNAIVFVGESLPFESFVLNEYQPSRFAIGQITRLNLINPSLDYQINLPHLKFLPSTSLKQLELIDVLVNPYEVIQTYVWPTRMESLKLRGFDTRLFTHEMLTRWPSTLKELTLGVNPWDSEYNTHDPASEIFIPSSIVHLSVDGLSIDVTSLQLPSGLIELMCTPTEQALHGWQLPPVMRRPKQALHGWKLPPSLKSLHFGRWFDSSVEKWIMPAGLKEVTFPSDFKQSIQGMTFSETLTHLNLGSFNDALIGIIFPATLIHLEFGPPFQQTLLGVGLPTGLKTLIYGQWIDPSIHQPDFSLPPSITHLELGLWNVIENDDEETATPLMIRLPPNLQCLEIPVCLLSNDSHLPITLEQLRILGDDDHGWSDISHLNEIFPTLPALRDLLLSSCKISSVQNLILPPSLKQIKFGRSLTKQPFIHTVVMGPKLKRVLFSGDFHESLNEVKFPDSIELIKFEDRCYFDQPIYEVVFPTSLRELHFGVGFCQSLDSVIFPSGLEVLSFSECSHFDKSLVHCKLPASLKVLQFSPDYDCSFSGFIVPPNLERFEMVQTDRELELLFTHIDSLIELQFPDTIKLIRLPNPLQYSYKKHPSLDGYQHWLFHLPRRHPSARIQLSYRWCGFEDPDMANDVEPEAVEEDEDQDDEGEDEDEDGVEQEED